MKTVKKILLEKDKLLGEYFLSLGRTTDLLWRK